MSRNGRSIRARARLKPRQTRAAVLLGAGMTQAAAAKTVGAGERTVRRWLTIPEFAAAVRREANRLAAEERPAILRTRRLAREVIDAALSDDGAPALERAARVAVKLLPSPDAGGKTIPREDVMALVKRLAEATEPFVRDEDRPRLVQAWEDTIRETVG